MRISSVNWLVVVATTISLLQALTGSAQNQYAGTDAGNKKKESNNQTVIPADPSVKIGKLSNGLTYYIRKNSTPENRAVLYLAVKAGSLVETDAQRGLAHFTEHMAFNGTKDFPKKELINYLQKAGVKFGADLDAYTSFEETVYQLPISTHNSDLFKTAFNILANWAGQVSLEGEEIDAERGVIVEEDRARGKNAQSRIQAQLLPVVLQGTRHASRLPIGDMELIKIFDHSQLRKFYKEWYRPDLMAVIAVGDFDPAEAEKLIKVNFSELRNPGKAITPIASSMPENIRPIIKKITDPETGNSSVSATIRFPGSVVTTVEQSTLEIYRSVAGTLINKRISELLLKGEVPAVSAKVSWGQYEGGLLKNLDALSVSVECNQTEDLTKALTIIMTELERARQFGFTNAEVEEIKIGLLANHESSYAEKNKVPSEALIQQYLNNFLLGRAMPSIEYSYEHIKSAVAKMTIDNLNELLEKMRQDKNIMIIINAPESDKNKLPSDEVLTGIMLSKTKGLQPYVDAVVKQYSLDKPNTGGKVVKKENLAQIGVTRWILSNGVQVYLKPTDFKNDQIIFRSFSPGGMSLSSAEDHWVNSYAPIIPASGIGDLDATQLSKFLQGTTARAGAYLEKLHHGFTGSSSPKDLETAMQLVYTSVTQPRTDTQTLRQAITAIRMSWQISAKTPEVVFADTINAISSSYHQRAKTATIDDVKQMSMEKSLKFYKDRFADNSRQVFVFVGNFVPDSIQSLVETYLGGLPVTGRKENFVDLGIRPLPGLVERTVLRGLEDKALVNLIFHDRFEAKVENEVQLVALTEILNYRMFDRLREKETGVYSPTVYFAETKLLEPRYSINVHFGCASGSVDKLISAAMEEVEILKREGATQTEINKFKAERLKSYPLSEKSNEFWLNYMLGSLQSNEDLNMIAGRRERLNTVTPESIKDAANKYLTGKNLMKAVLLPEKKYGF